MLPIVAFGTFCLTHRPCKGFGQSRLTPSPSMTRAPSPSCGPYPSLSCMSMLPRGALLQDQTNHHNWRRRQRGPVGRRAPGRVTAHASANGFGASSTPKRESSEHEANTGQQAKGHGPSADDEVPTFVQAPKGIGTLFEREDEVIRELSSEEYTNVLREWAPLATFAASEAKEIEVMTAAKEIRTVLRGMAVRVRRLRHQVVCRVVLAQLRRLIANRLTSVVGSLYSSRLSSTMLCSRSCAPSIARLPRRMAFVSCSLSSEQPGHTSPLAFSMRVHQLELASPDAPVASWRTSSSYVGFK